MNERIWVVLPTYNEADNVARIVPAICDQLERVAPDSYRVLVVDDSSPDGTGEIAERLAAELGTVEVLHRERKDGLGRAYVDGFRRALAGGADLIIQMDADFSHDPKYLPAMIAGAHDADLVIGSRYVQGGGVENWGLARRIISRGGSIYSRVLLGVRTRDLTGGFKCIRRQVLERIDLDAVRAYGYVFQIEVTYRAILAGFIVREVPIVFPDRSAGASKMSWQIAAEAMLAVPHMRRAVHH
jgi:dolichol-phosphate mannosyltransferase